ncbi:MAG: carboxypeptidase regulatory-like domain-containing protein, partial [Methanobacteriota archaeon]
MKTWGLSRWGPLLAVLTLLVSAGVLVPLNAQAAGKTVFGFVTDCANLDSVGATVSLVDAQAQLPTVNTTSSSTIGYYSFSNPTPAYYRVRVQPVGFTYFTGESAVFRFDGTASKRVDVCVVKMRDRDRWVNLTVIDAQPAAVSGESVNFQEFARGPENATEAGHLRYNQGTFVVQLDTKPLKWNSEKLFWVDGANRFGTFLIAAQYVYNTADALVGRIHITDGTVLTELA